MGRSYWSVSSQWKVHGQVQKTEQKHDNEVGRASYPPHFINPAWLAQLVKRRSAELEAAGSSPGRTNTQGFLNIWEERAAFGKTSANG